MIRLWCDAWCMLPTDQKSDDVDTRLTLHIILILKEYWILRTFLQLVSILDPVLLNSSLKMFLNWEWSIPFTSTLNPKIKKTKKHLLSLNKFPKFFFYALTLHKKMTYTYDVINLLHHIIMIISFNKKYEVSLWRRDSGNQCSRTFVRRQYIDVWRHTLTSTSNALSSNW